MLGQAQVGGWSKNAGCFLCVHVGKVSGFRAGYTWASQVHKQATKRETETCSEADTRVTSHTDTHTELHATTRGGGSYTTPCLGPQMPLHSHPYAVAQSFPYTRRQAVSHTHTTPSASAVTPAHAHVGTHTTKSHMPPCSTGRPGLGHHPQWHP